MKIAIISDVHNNISNLKKVINYCKINYIKKIICCGDLASKETLDYFCNNFPGEIYYVFGNMDDAFLKTELFGGIKESAVNYKNAKVFRYVGNLKIKNKNILFVHFPDMARKLCQKEKCDVVFYGHTHKPWEEYVEKCKMLNPGNVANEFYPPSFAVWNIDENSFILVKINGLN